MEKNLYILVDNSSRKINRTINIFDNNLEETQKKFLYETLIKVKNPEDLIFGISEYYIDDSGVAVVYNNEKLLIDIKNNELREKRGILLAAFDLWEKAVLRGREEDSEEIMQWYQDILDLNENSILDNIPEKITYYL